MKTKTIQPTETRYPRLTRAILRRLDREQLEDVARCGADAGWPGMNKHCLARQTARRRAAKCLREWRKTRAQQWRHEYRSAIQWDKRMEVSRG